ncbi:MAG TPA: hypothetical protein VGH21_03090 [Solirubrobacteraceae bacterium]
MRTVKRPRRYLAKHWLFLLGPMFGYDFSRNAYVLRGVGNHFGPVLREERRMHRERNRLPWAERPWQEEQEPDASERRWAMWA